MFLVAGFTLPRVIRRSSAWRPLAWPSLLLVGGSIVTGFLRSGNAPGLGQRLGFACFFLWVALIGYPLSRDLPVSADERAEPIDEAEGGKHHLTFSSDDKLPDRVQAKPRGNRVFAAGRDFLLCVYLGVPPFLRVTRRLANGGCGRCSPHPQ